MSIRLADLQPWMYPYAVELVRRFPQLQLTSVRRTLQEQRNLWTAYVHGASRYPAAPPGTSLHEFGRAFDLEGPAALLAQAGAQWEYWGGRWGARFGDPIHFEA